MYRINFVFAKKGILRYISHLDLMRLLSRALRRSGFLLKVTEGFNPHVKISMARALKLGLESDHEEASVVLRQIVSPDDFCSVLNKQLPEGVTIKSASNAI